MASPRRQSPRSSESARSAPSGPGAGRRSARSGGSAPADTGERLQKILARAGIASRRAAEEIIVAGRVRVDGRVVDQLGSRVDPRSSVVELDGKRIIAEPLVYVALHKPRNVVATMSDPEGRPTAAQLLADVPGRVYPVGRLDFATSGLLLATNDGDFAAALLHPRRAVPKTYVLKVLGLMSEQDVEHWRRGVNLDDGPTLPAKVKLLRHEEGKTWLELTIVEGRNQQIRRMGEATGFRVMRLARTSFAGITSEGLPPGRWRYLTRDELAGLQKQWGVPKRVFSPPSATKRDMKEGRSKPRAAPRNENAPTRSRHEGSRGSSRAGVREAGGGRYGGGAPARRDASTTEDWGGGVRRGSSGSRDDLASQGGRTGRLAGGTRTTGTGGGVHAEGGGDFRVKGRRGR